MNKKEFAKGVENLINPIEVGSLHFIQGFNSLLPKKLQEYFVTTSAQKYPNMGFVVEPYSTFLCYEIIDLERAKSLIPKEFKLIKTKIFDTDEPKYYCIFGCIRAHTSAFWGSRVEFYIIAEDTRSGLLSWLIIDYDSNTISYDKKHGLKTPNSSKSVVTINHKGTIYVDFPRDDKSRRIAYETNVEDGKMKKLDQRLWLEGNLSIGYGVELNNGKSEMFSLKFDPDEVEAALSISSDNLKLEENSWFSGLFNPVPSQIACFPYAQHFVSDSPGFSSFISDRESLVKAANKVDFANVEVFSTKSFRTTMLLGTLIALTTTIVLLLLYLYK